MKRSEETASVRQVVLKEPHGSQAEAHPRGLEEEPDLPRGRRRFALARDGKFLEIVGRYNPQTDPSTIDLDEAKVKDWLGKGAQPTEAVAKLIKISGIEK